jgi:hypothetical protein
MIKAKRFDKRLRDARCTWLSEYPKSWAPTILRHKRRQLTRLLERIEKIENQ